MMVTIQSAESNRAVVRYLSEATWGTTPGSGIVKTMRITSSSLVASKDTQQSDEIRSDRMIPSIIEVAASTEGDVEFEFSAGGQDDFFQQFLLGAWTEAMTHFISKGAQVAVTGVSEITVSGGDYTNYLTDEDYVKLEGFVNLANNGYFKIDVLAFSGGNTVITVDETTLVVEGGSAYTKIVDASDVILKSTTTAFTSGNTVNGGGSNSFSGKGLIVGQTVFIDSALGKETGTFEFVATDPAEGDTFTVNDGVDSVTFEIRTNAALVSPGNVHVAFSGTPATLAASALTAINTEFAKENIRCTATIATATLTITNHRSTGGTLSDSGSGITTTNFSGGVTTKGGFRTIASLPNDDTFTTTETTATDANSGTTAVVIKGSHLRNPGDADDITKQSISVETRFTDVNKQFLHTGLRAGGFTLSVKTGEIVTGKFSFMGRETTAENSTVLGNTGTYTVLDTVGTDVFNATANVGTVKKDGTALTTAIMSVELEGDANLRAQRAVGERFPAGIGYGRFSLTGTIEAYFEDFTLFNDFLDHVTASLSFDFEDADHNYYSFVLPAVKFTADPIAPGGIDQDVMEPIEFSAQRSPSLRTMMMINRFSSIYPASAVA